MTTTLETEKANEEEEAEENKVIPISTVTKSIVSNWINKKKPIEDTIIETNQMIQNMNNNDFEQYAPELSKLLAASTNADGDKVFKNEAQAADYLRRIRNNRRNKKKLYYIPKEIEHEIKLENKYSKQLSPLMKRTIVANSVTRSQYLKSYE